MLTKKLLMGKERQSEREHSIIKTHSSESQGQEEVACATTTVSYLHGWQL